MITWLNYWPVMLLPTAILSALAALPTRMFNGHLIGGGPVRQYFLNHFLLPLLPSDAASSLVAWFSTASGLQEWLLSFAVAINLNALALPLLYAMGVLIIGLSSWVSKKNIDLKRQAVR
jgi:hypothetical protein